MTSSRTNTSETSSDTLSTFPEGPDERACYVASVGPDRDPYAREAQLAEIVSLTTTRGHRIVGSEILRLVEPRARTFLGKGTAEALAARARAAGATMLVLDAELSPSQTRNLEEVTGMPICDREAVILGVFLRHARTRKARIQVDIAELEYLRPRIRGVGLDMDQQMGGLPGARGPGETASELLARKLDGRLHELRKALRRIETSGRTQRKERNGDDACKRIALVGYTNAGKTSLMNALTGADLSAKDAPFETLDTTTRSLTRHGGDVILSDTVGFIRRLPDRLLESFESTLAEVAEASLLVLVVDVSDVERALHLRTTRDLVAKVGAGDVPRLVVFTKADRLITAPRPAELARLAGGDPWVFLSTTDREAVADLGSRLLEEVRKGEDEVTAFVPWAASDRLALVYRTCRVLGSVPSDEGLTLHVRGPRKVTSRIREGDPSRTRDRVGPQP
ncbi:MAG: GTPase HflX [Polyangiaceae bacterium]